MFGDGTGAWWVSVDDAVPEVLSVSAPFLRQHSNVGRWVESLRSDVKWGEPEFILP
jgi:hypothetical protein